MIDQRSALLNQLRLERDDAPSAGGSARKWRALGVGISLLVASGAAAWFVLESKAAPVVRVATAKPTVGNTAARHGPGYRVLALLAFRPIFHSTPVLPKPPSPRDVWIEKCSTMPSSTCTTG